MKRTAHVFEVIALISVLAVTGLAILTRYYGWSIHLELLSHFQAQYFLAVLLLTILTLRLRYSVTVLVALFCTALLSAQIVPWYVSSPLTHPDANYRVLVANINKHTFDASRVLDVVAQEKPDLAFLIEVNSETAQQLQVLSQDLPYAVQEPIAPDFDLALYSRYPLQDIEIIHFGNKNNKQSLVAHVTVAGRPLTLVGTHPSSPTDKKMFRARNTVLADVGDYIQKETEPVVLMGDFNTTMWSPYYRTMVRKTQLKNTREGFGIRPTWPRMASRYGWPGWVQTLTTPLQIPIDHCLVSPQIAVAGIHTGGDTGSDHAPIVVDLAVQPQA